MRMLRVLALLAAGGAAWAAGPPEVFKVEPPNWWLRHSLNPVRVLIHGRNLRDARVEAQGPGMEVSAVRTNAAGTYLFADLRVAGDAAPGPHPLLVATPLGTAAAPFELLAPLPREGRFQGFSPDDLVYLVMPDRFADGDPSNDDPPVSRGLFDRSRPRYYHGGDLAGIRQHLPYLKSLGVTALWLNPIYDNVNHLNQRERYDGQAITDYHGYGAVDFYGVEEHFGTLAQYRALVDAAHGLGTKVIQDQVANHTGPYHPWVEDPPKAAWYHRHAPNTWQIWTLADPYAGPDTRRATLDGWFLNILPDLNQDDPEVARYLIQNALWWVGVSGEDGIRQDTLPYVPRRFWHDWSAALHCEYPRLKMVGEAWDGDAALVSFFQGGRAQYDGVDTGVDALFDFPLYFAIRRVFAEGQPVRELPLALSRDRLYPHPERLFTFLGSHDVARFLNERGADAAGLKLAYTFLLTTRGIPLIYYGDEIGMRGGNDPDNRRDFPGGWPGDAHNAFEASGRTSAERDIFDHVARLARLRQKLEPLRRGTLVELLAEERQYVYARVSGGEAAIMAFNTAAAPAAIDCALPEGAAANAEWRDALGSGVVLRAAGGRLGGELPPRWAGVFTPGGAPARTATDPIPRR